MEILLYFALTVAPHIVTVSENTDIPTARELVHAALIEHITLCLPRTKKKQVRKKTKCKEVMFVHRKFRPQNARCNVNTEANTCSKKLLINAYC
jgi:hypothetical protein